MGDGERSGKRQGRNVASSEKKKGRSDDLDGVGKPERSKNEDFEGDRGAEHEKKKKIERKREDKEGRVREKAKESRDGGSRENGGEDVENASASTKKKKKKKKRRDDDDDDEVADAIEEEQDGDGGTRENVENASASTTKKKKKNKEREKVADAIEEKKMRKVAKCDEVKPDQGQDQDDQSRKKKKRKNKEQGDEDRDHGSKPAPVVEESKRKRKKDAVKDTGDAGEDTTKKKRKRDAEKQETDAGDGDESKPRKKKKKRDAAEGKSATTSVTADELGISNENAARTDAAARGSETARKKTKKRVTFGETVVLNNDHEKKVRFDEHVQLLNTPTERPLCPGRLKDPLYLEKFTKEEDDAMKAAANKFAEDHAMELDDTYRLFITPAKNLPSAADRRLQRELGQAIGTSVPGRQPRSVRVRAKSVLDIFSKQGRWTKEEEEQLNHLVETYGKDWNKIGQILQRKTHLIESKYDYINSMKKRGGYTAKEIATVTAAVHQALANHARLNTPRQRQDDIPWRSIAKLVPGRPSSHFRVLWYRDLCSPMVKTKEWGTGDDHRLLLRILESGAADEESIDWDNLLTDRSGEVCIKRWHEMRAHLGHKWNWPFEKKLEVLIQRFAPCFLEEPAAPCSISSAPEPKRHQEQGQEQGQEHQEQQ